MGFWSNLLGFFGIGKKKNIEEEQLQNLPKPEVVQREELEEEIPRENDVISDIGQGLNPKEEKRLSPTGLPVTEENEMFNIAKENQVNRSRGKTRVTEQLMSKWNSLINPNGEVRSLGVYDSAQSVESNAFNIYRNIILKNINNDAMINDIYRSGVLEQHIVGYVHLTYTKGNNPKPITRVFEVQGLTPKDIRCRRLFNLADTTIHTQASLKVVLENTCGIPSDEVNGIGYDINIQMVKISFDYA